MFPSTTTSPPRDATSITASSWLQLRRALRGAAITIDDVLVDFGSGMGRMVYVAARHYPFGRVVGVEISQRFNDVALANLERARPRLRCPRTCRS